MNIAILAFGSQGDVQPYIALGVGLQRAGHHIRIITHENYETHVKTQNLEFHPVQGNVQAVMDSPELRALIEKGNFLAINAYTSKLVKDISLLWLQAGLEACRDVELIVTGVGGLYTGLAIAEKLDLPIVQAPVFPFTPTADFPGVLLPQSLGKLGGLFNRLSHGLVRQIMWQGTRAADNAARKHLGLPTAPFFGPYGNARLNRSPTLYGFSPSVIPTPRDWTNAKATGYWFLDAAPDWQPPAALEQFLQDGPPPVYIGFGSMGSRNPEETANLVLQAVANTKQRAILHAGWGGLKQDRVPEHVHMIGQTPHSWLFPKMAAVVHHGGAGTTAAGLRAGVPSIIVPFFGDQPFWGERIAQLGVGTKPIPRKQLNADNLAQAIQTTTGNSSMQKAAAQLGANIRAEDGIEQFVRALEKIKG